MFNTHTECLYLCVSLDAHLPVVEEFQGQIITLIKLLCGRDRRKVIRLKKLKLLSKFVFV